MRRVAVLGTGTMGGPMAANMAAAGLEVRVWNRDADRARALEQKGVEVAGDPSEALEGIDAFVTMLPTGKIVRDVVEPVLDRAGGAIWIQMSTVGAEAADELAELASEHEVEFVDAPVSGTKEPAEEGKLVVLASGPEGLRERVNPVFEAVGSRTLWLGPAGAGSRMKLVVNTWLLAVVEGLAETVALAEGLGLDAAEFLKVIEGGPLDLPYAQLKGKAMLERSFEPSFALELAAKDAGLVRAAAAKAQLDLPLPGLIAERLERGVRDGHGREDMSAAVTVARGER